MQGVNPANFLQPTQYSNSFSLIAMQSLETGPVVMHDWWIYQLITGVGGSKARPSSTFRVFALKRATWISSANDLRENSDLRTNLPTRTTGKHPWG